MRFISKNHPVSITYQARHVSNSKRCVLCLKITLFRLRTKPDMSAIRNDVFRLKNNPFSITYQARCVFDYYDIQMPKPHTVHRIMEDAEGYETEELLDDDRDDAQRSNDPLEFWIWDQNEKYVYNVTGRTCLSSVAVVWVAWRDHGRIFKWNAWSIETYVLCLCFIVFS